MRLPLLSLALLLLALPASAQPSDRPGGWSPWIRAYTLGGSDGGLTFRNLVGGEWHVGGPLSLGIVQRSSASIRLNSEESRERAFCCTGRTTTYTEFGPSVRASLRSERVEVATSVGIAGAGLLADASPFDAGVTVPLEVEATVALGRGFGLTAAASRSLPVTSVWSNFERFEDQGYELRNRTLTLGLRMGM